MNEQHLRKRQEYHHLKYVIAEKEGDDAAYLEHLEKYNKVTNELNEWLRSCEG